MQVAIIRPGPIVGKMMNPYMERRMGRQEVRYAHPLLEPVLRRTLGVPLFQEQLLRIAMVIANFDPAMSPYRWHCSSTTAPTRPSTRSGDYLRKHQPPFLAVWGKNDPILKS